MLRGTIRNDDFLAQHSVAMLEQCCKHLKHCRNNVATLCCAKNRRDNSSRSRAPAFITRRTIYDEMEGLDVLDRALRLD